MRVSQREPQIDSHLDASANFKLTTPCLIPFSLITKNIRIYSQRHSLSNNIQAGHCPKTSFFLRILLPSLTSRCLLSTIFYWDRTHEWVEYSDSRSNLQEIPQRHETSTITSDDVFKKWFLGRSSWVSDEDRGEILTSLRACGILRKLWKPVEESVGELQVQHAY